MDWHLNIGGHGETAGLMGTILNHLQKQEQEKWGLLRKYKKAVKPNEELQASAQESSGPNKGEVRKLPVGQLLPPGANVQKHQTITPK